jgi:hypothetical protein
VQLGKLFAARGVRVRRWDLNTMLKGCSGYSTPSVRDLRAQFVNGGRSEVCDKVSCRSRKVELGGMAVTVGGKTLVGPVI